MDNEEKKRRDRERMRVRRAEAKAAGAVIPGDDWAKNNPAGQRARVARWRERNIEASRSINRATQARRRSTPWGAINNRIWPIMHAAVRRASPRPSKYTEAMGHLWSDLRAHLEAQFTPEMNWENWGPVWEVDHIKPVSSFQYQSLADPLFREAWALSNLRPLLRGPNAAKGNRIAAE